MYKKEIAAIIFFYFGILVGGLCVLLSISHGRAVLTAYNVTATVIDIRTYQMWDVMVVDGIVLHETRRAAGLREVVYVIYEINDSQIISALSRPPEGVRVGQHIEVLISNRGSHEIIAAGIAGWRPYIFMAMFAITLLYARKRLLADEKRRLKLHKWLLDHGTPIWANVKCVEEDNRMQVNNAPAIVVVANTKDEIFISQPVNNIDLSHLGAQVKILIHPNNTRKYTFDFFNESVYEPPV